MELEKKRPHSSVVSVISGLDMGGGDDMLSGAADSGAKVTIDGKWLRAVSPEGQTASLPIAELAGKIAPARMNTCGVILPDGVKAVLCEGHVVLWVHETPPSVMNLKWIAKDSPVKFGPQT